MKILEEKLQKKQMVEFYKIQKLLSSEDIQDLISSVGGELKEQNSQSFEKFVNFKIMEPIPEMKLVKWRKNCVVKIGKLKKSNQECQIAETQDNHLVIWHEGTNDEDFGILKPLTIVKEDSCRKLRMKYKDNMIAIKIRKKTMFNKMQRTMIDFPNKED